MARLRLTLLGGLDVQAEGGPPTPFARQKVAALLAFLALKPGQLHRRDKLAALLWPDAPGPRARQSLRQALAELRQALGPALECLVERRDAVGLEAETVEVDVVTFERLLAAPTPDALKQAVTLYRGDLLEGLRISEPAFEDWLMAERERLRELTIEALARLLAEHLRIDAIGPALQVALRLVSLDPLQESVHRVLMRLYLRLGRRSAGLRQYQICLDVLRHELGVEPEPETRQTYLELLQAPASGGTAAISPRLESAQQQLEPFGLRRAIVMAALANAYVPAGRLAQARETIERVLAMSAALAFAWGKAAVLRVRGLIAREEGDSASARQHLAAALELVEAMPARLEAGRLHLDLATTIARNAAGRTADAVVHLDAARVAFAAARASRYTEQVERVAAALGGDG